MDKRDYRLAVVKLDEKYQLSCNPGEDFEEFRDYKDFTNRLLEYAYNHPGMFVQEPDISGLSRSEETTVGRIRELALKIKESNLEESVLGEADDSVY